MRKSPVYSEEELARRRQVCVDRNTKHGMSKLPEYKIWKGIKKRCFNPNDKRFAHYGGRGITICQEWKEDFVAFYNYVGPRPKDGQKWSIGRMDNNDDYKPGNVRWELDEEQARNHSLQANNRTGYVGIQYRERVVNGKTYRFYAGAISVNKVKKVKQVSIDKYGKELALQMCLQWRKEQLELLAAQGIVYAETHGTFTVKE